MCEPMHSMIQFDDPNDKDDSDNDQSAQAGGHSFGRICGKLSQWSKKLGRWLHVSRLGFGHSETVGRLVGGNVIGWHYEEGKTLYEANWATRDVKVDGRLHVPHYDRDIAIQRATEYANMVSIGNLTTLRNFLEVSLRETDRPWYYMRMMHEYMLTSKGKRAMEHDLRQKFSLKSFDFDSFRSLQELQNATSRKSLTKLMLGYTRRRKLLIPAWADDGQLWQ